MASPVRHTITDPGAVLKTKAFGRLSQRNFFFLCLSEEINDTAVALYVVSTICKVSEWL